MGVNVPPSFGFDGMCKEFSLANAAYFNNHEGAAELLQRQLSRRDPLDTSLQLEVAMQQYGQFNTYKAPAACTLGK